MIEQFAKGEAFQLSKNFTSEEMDCHCAYADCLITYIDLELIDKLQQKREEWGVPIFITSGFRCTRHNSEVGGKKGSLHLVGKAADIKAEGLEPWKVASLCEDFDGLGRYPTFTHVDVRGYKARWKG